MRFFGFKSGLTIVNPDLNVFFSKLNRIKRI